MEFSLSPYFYLDSNNFFSVDYPPGYFPDPTKKLGMQPDLTANTSAGSTNSGVGLLFPEYTYPGSSVSNNKDNVPLTPGKYIKLLILICMYISCMISYKLSFVLSRHATQE